MDSAGRHSAELAKSIKTTLKLSENFDFNASTSDVKRVLMDSYVAKLSPGYIEDNNPTAAISVVGQGIFIYFLYFYI